MKYTDLSTNIGFHKNMRETNWLKLFPTWWAENDPLLQTIGKEVAYIKAESIFALLNVTIKPPVMIWQESLNHKDYTESFTINKKKEEYEESLSELVKLPAPLYKAYGSIKIKNNTIDDIDNLKISFNDDDYIIISDIIQTDDVITVNIGSQKVYINKNEANIITHGEGLSYFKTGINKTECVPDVDIITDDDIIEYKIKLPSDFDGKISLINNDKDITLYNDFFNDVSYSDDINLDTDNNILERSFYVANVSKDTNINVRLYNSSLYFDTYMQIPTKEYKVDQTPNPLHNEAINLFFDFGKIEQINMDIDVIFDNVVFINEQTMEVNGLELIPIESINLYAYYDFPYNPTSTGWRKVYEKKYDPKTNVVYDMITTHFYTKKFYVEVFYKGIDFPYRVGFPCFKDADEDSMYHINDNIDKWGEYLGLKRREYKVNIPEEDYPYTYPAYYPFDIEQDYWYYQRLVNEYAWNDLAINQVDLIDTNGDPVIRLHSINPFIEDFVVYANSTYPTEQEDIDYNFFTPDYVKQDIVEAEYKRMPYYDTQNLLRYDNNKSSVTLLNKAETNITTQRYLSKPLRSFFDLTYLPADIDIDDITILIEAESTDNNIDKYSNSETGIIIPGISDEKLFKMTQSESYELKEKEIEYHLSTEDINEIKKYIHQQDVNVSHDVTIGTFEAKQGSYFYIPFILKENDEIVDDITDVYVTYDHLKTIKKTTYDNTRTFTGEYHSDEKGRYIKVWLPILTTKYTTMRLSCKSNYKNSFSTGNILLEAFKQDKKIEDQNITFQYVRGPIENETPKTLHIKEDWHTSDLRNILQKDGIYFINTFENDNTTNTPVILIKNIRLKINHTKKKPQFTLETQLKTNQVKEPYIGQLEVTITNIGLTQLKTKIDIVHASNIKLSQTYIDVDLDVGKSTTEKIYITPEYPILDGVYDIVTICQDKQCYNTITLSSNGLIPTGIKLKQTYSIYQEPIHIVGSVISDYVINEGKVSFYVNQFKIGETNITDNKINTIIDPTTLSSNLQNMLIPGTYTLEARFSGTEKFAPSRLSTTLIIIKNKTNIELISDSVIVYSKPHTINTFITSNDENINEGSVIFYLNNERIGTKKVVNGEASLLIDNFKYEPKDYVLKAEYTGTEKYASEETSQTVTVIGGKTTIVMQEISAKPGDNITLQAMVSNVHNMPISTGYIQFTIIDNNKDILYITDPQLVYQGLAQQNYQIANDILNDVDEQKIFTIQASYFDLEEKYQNSENFTILTIERGNVVLYCNNVFFGSQHEPLGFLVQVKDADTNIPVTDGYIDVSIPDLDLYCPSTPLDNDGYARIIYNPLKFSGNEFEQLLNFIVTQGKYIGNLQPLYEDELAANLDVLDDFSVVDSFIFENDNNIYYTIKDITRETPLNDLNGAVVNLRMENGTILWDEFETTDTTLIKDLEDLSVLNGLLKVVDSLQEPKITYQELLYTLSPLQDIKRNNLYRIYDGNIQDLSLMDFRIENIEINNKIVEKHLIYEIKNKDGTVEDMEQIFIDTDGHLYARSTLDSRSIREYQEGHFPVNISYISNDQYKNKNKNNTIELVKSITDIDVQSYSLKYSDNANKSVVCYVTEYNLGTDQTTTVVNDGQVTFFIDNTEIKTSDITHGFAKLYLKDIYNIPYGPHFLTIEYMDENKPNTYTYAILNLNPMQPTIEYKFNQQFKGEQSKLKVSIGVDEEYDLPITGNVNIYMDNILITSQEISNNETDINDGIYKTILNFIIDMPTDIDTAEHILTIKYSGNDHILPAEENVILQEQKKTVTINTDQNIYVAQNDYCNTTYTLSDQDNSFINDGEIFIYQKNLEEKILKGKGNVQNNKATIKWQVDDILGEQIYIVEFKNSKHYIAEPLQQTVIIIEPLDEVYIAQESLNDENVYDDSIFFFKTLEEALQCVINTGNVHILDSVNIDKDIVINKDINIIGHNNSKIIKNTNNLLTNTSIKQYHFTDFSEPLYEIVGLKITHLNDTDFHIIDTDIYFVDNVLIPIFYLEDDKFYSYKSLSLSIILNNTNLTLQGETNISNVHISSNDNFIINAANNINMQKVIIDNNVIINNQSSLKVNNSAIYGKIIGSDKYNLDNNWWGSNDAPQHNINNQILLKIWTPNEPPVIGEKVQVYCGLIGQNDVTYDLPSLPYSFSADTGDFTNANGYLVENIAYTTYFNSIEECDIECTIDNETVVLKIYNYDRKTKIIFEPMQDIPIGYQIPIKVKVQSLAEVYYQFDDDLNIITQKNNINGHMNFFLDNKKIGYTSVVNGTTQLPIYLSENNYSVGQQYILEAEFIPEDYYFQSSASKTITLISDDDNCFVSLNGKNNGDGTYSNPYNSIQQAMLDDKSTVYLQDGVYVESNIQVNRTKTIKAYNNPCVFQNNEDVIFIHTDGKLSLYNLTFEKNQNCIIQSDKEVEINKCIFTDNTFDYLIDNGTNTLVQNSVILNNRGRILKTYDQQYNIKKCWFGTNTPNENSNEPITLTDYIVMDLASSLEKDINSNYEPYISLGSVAFLTASIKHYYNGTYKVLTDDELPLRIVQFYTTHGTLMPIKDYTYHNQATTFLNTNTANNADKLLIQPLQNDNYIDRPVVLKCQITDVQGNNINAGQVRFKVTYNNEPIFLYGDIEDGVATVTYSTPLPIGKYQLECTYNQYSTISTFTISEPNIIVSNFNIANGDHLYNLDFNLDIVDSFNNKITHIVNIYVDDIFIKQAKIIQGTLIANISYDFLTLGNHQLKISTDDIDSNYAYFETIEDFTVSKKDTHIVFDCNGVPTNEQTDLTFYVYDNNNRVVQDGYIDIKYDNETVYFNNKDQYDINGQKSTLKVVNGVATLYNFNVQEQGQHILTIYYYGTNTFYNDCMYVNTIDVGLQDVVIESDELKQQLVADIGQPLKLYFPIRNAYDGYIRRGYVNLFLDDVKLLNDEPLPIVEGYVEFNQELPSNTLATQHDLLIVYTDPSEKYVNTTYKTQLNVNKIKTQIVVDTINAMPNSKTTVNYLINSKYGPVKIGQLKAYYDDNLIGQADVSELNNSIELNIPNLPATDTYNIVFKFTATNNNYEDTSIVSILNIQKTNVVITPLIKEYYPHTNFKYEVEVKDQNGNDINTGTITLYIDNVETATTNVYLGKATIPLLLDTVKEYSFNILYNNNNYYSETSKTCSFNVNNITINDIQISTTASIPNTNIETTLLFNTPNNINVTDGFVDIIIDNIKIGSFAVVEDIPKYIKLSIPDLKVGTYDMIIKYYNSETFKKTSFTKKFEIKKQNINISVPEEYEATLNDEITFNTLLDKKVDGTLEYVLIEDNEGAIREQLIGIKQINKETQIPFTYQLSKITPTPNTTYEIAVQFTNNNQYYNTIKRFSLIIVKDEIETLALYVDDTAIYQSTINITAKTSIKNNALIHFYIDDQEIGYRYTKDTDNNGYINIQYDLNNTFVPGEYTIKAVIEESVTYHQKETEETITIIKDTPYILNTHITAYVGQKILLPTKLINNRGIEVESGELTFTIDEDTVICIPQEQKEYQLNNTYSEEKEITVSYQADTNSYYNNTTQTIILSLEKSALQISIDNYGPVTRGKTITENITFSSKIITNIPNNLTYRAYLEDVQVTLPTLEVPINLPDQDKYLLRIDFDGNDLFLPTSQTFQLINNNVSKINLSEVDSLAMAINLVAEYGTINIDEDVENININNNKHITINGNGYTFNNCQINNDGYLTIKNATFTNCNDSVIKNNGELYVQECIFMYNQAQYGAAIFIDNKNINTEITRCTFKQNNASLYGGAIFSNTGNDVTIKECKFYDQNNANVKGSSISSKGNMYLSQNMFYNNSGENEIYVISGNLNAENNYFDGLISSIENKGTTNCELNYWGWNDINSIQNNNVNIDFNSWLISSYTITYKEARLGEIHQFVTGKINQYKTKVESENFLYKRVIGDVPIIINDETVVLNKELEFINQNIQIQIGQEHFNIEG